ncbi:MAG: hypothetical protein J7L12_00835 [Desulfurococcales archaeon]|nr:hypothetical protein [Desulfurococcales archaeon]
MPLDFRGSNASDVFREFIEDTKETENYVRVIIDYSIESAVLGGLLCKALREFEIGFELINNLFEIPLDATRQLLINTKAGKGGSSLALMSSSINTVRKTSLGYIIESPVLEEKLLDVISEYVIVPREIKYMLASSILARHTPRILRGELSQNEEEFINKLEDENLIRKVRGPMIIGWGYLQPEEAVKYSVDLLIPRYFMRETSGEVSDDTIARELGVSKERIVGTNYVIKQDWCIKDLYYLAYTMMCIVDEEGIEGLVAAVLNPSTMVWHALKMYEYLGKLRAAIDEYLAGNWESKGKFKVMHLKNPPPLSMLTRVLQGIGRMGQDEVVVNEAGGKVSVPLQVLTRRGREELRTRAVIEKGYAVLSSADVLSKVST